MIEVHITKVNTSEIIYQKTLLTYSEPEQISKSGIPEIIADYFGKGSISKSIFFDEKKYEETDDIIKIKRWIRERNISTVYLAYGSISGSDLKYKYADSKILSLKKSIEEKVLNEYNLLKDLGEYAKVIHLGQYSKYNHEFNLTSLDIDYQLIDILLKDNKNGVIFYGTNQENALIESFLSKEKRVNYWCKWVWN